jgi:hypothetical protein
MADCFPAGDDFRAGVGFFVTFLARDALVFLPLFPLLAVDLLPLLAMSVPRCSGIVTLEGVVGH